MLYKNNNKDIFNILNDFLSGELYNQFQKDNSIQHKIWFFHNMILPKNNPDIILFWTPTIDLVELINNIKLFYKNKIFLHNWDPTFTQIDHQHWKDSEIILLNNSKIVDCVFTVNPLEVEFYEKNGCKGIHCYSGFDDNFSKPCFDEKYKCDVSAVITNLYNDSIWDINKQKINRKTLIDQLYNNKSINLHIYGNENIKNAYPDSYKGFISYNNCNKVFSNSSINLCIHAISIDGYLSERAAQIIGSGGLLFTDNEIGIGFIPGIDYELVHNSETAYEQIINLLNDEEKRKIMISKSYEKRENINWDKFINLIINENNK